MARPFCAEVSHENGETLAATASRVEHWILVEYPGVWSRQVVAGSGLSPLVKDHLSRQLTALPRSRLLFIRRPERRRRSELRCFFGRSHEREQRFFGVALESYEDLASIDFTAAVLGGGGYADIDHPLLVVCTHGKRDRCCARYGRPLYEELAEQADERWVWQSTHVGGDRFAGNVVCLPHGLYFGRVGRSDVWPLLDEYLAGRVYLDRFRGRACYSFAVQAAERVLREETGLAGIDDVRLLASERRDGSWRIELAAEDRVHELDVVAELGELTYLTCSASSLQRPRRFRVTGRRVRPAARS